METLHLSQLEPDLAGALLTGCEHLDPRGITTAADLGNLARGGQCYLASAEAGQCVYVVKVQNGIAWVDAIKGHGPVRWSLVMPPVIEAQAKGLRAVAFQTARPGLVRQLEAQGYRTTGWVLRKDLQP